MLKNKQKLSKDYISIENNAGFTLVELIISIAVFTIGLTATFGLALSNYNTSNNNLDKIIATNLAREGIELIRNVRDSNWLKIEANQEIISGGPFDPYTWDYSLVDNNGYMYIDYNDSFPTTFSCIADIKSCVINCTECLLYLDNTNGYYDHDNTGTITKYSRGIKLNKICTDETAANPQDNENTSLDTNQNCSDLGSNYKHIGFKVVSHVQWNDNSTIKFVEITDKIYNWRR